MRRCLPYHEFIKQLDPDAVIGLGPVPVSGNDKTFPAGYTVYGEKAPNARGVKRVVHQLSDNGHLHEYESFIAQLNDSNSNVGAVIITGNYPDTWPSDKYIDEFIVAITNRFTIAIDTLQNQFTAMADVVFPSATWVEKAGSFENVNNLIQPFTQAIKPVGLCRSEAQIALDLTAAARSTESVIYDAERVRTELAGPFTDLQLPAPLDMRKPDMQYVDL